MLISLEHLEESEKRHADLEKKLTRDNVSESSTEALIKDVSPEITKGNILGADENLTKRKEMLATINQEPVDFAFERAIGKNDSVYSNFVELIRNAKQKVGRVAIKKGNRNVGFATGFMVAKNLMLTNWHVFPAIEEVAESELQFFYELDTTGNPGTAVSFKLNSELFYHSNKELDYCFVAVAPADTSGKVQLNDVGYIFLDPALGKLGNEGEEALNIIHHPDGDYKQLSIRKNIFVKITPVSIWYETDTAPGSSGSPVFNDQWQVVALHHSGIGKKNDAGDYIDKDGKVIPTINGKIDSSKVVWVANEGIRISVILKDLFSNNSDNKIVGGLKIRPELEIFTPELMPANEKELVKGEKLKTLNLESDYPPYCVHISIPASLVEKSGTINIKINPDKQIVKGKKRKKRIQ